MKREVMLRKLETVVPALSDNAIIPALRDFWFIGTRLMAHDDHIAISVKCETDFKGAVPSTLLSLLNASVAREVEFEVAGSQLLVKAAFSKFKVPILSPEAFNFSMPKISSKVEALADGTNLRNLIDGIEYCSKSLGSDPAVAEMNGIDCASVSMRCEA